MKSSAVRRGIASVAWSVALVAGVAAWADPPTTTGAAMLDAHTINSVVEAHASLAQSCYDTAHAADPSLHGRVVVQFVIGSTGHVVSTTVTDQSPGLAQVASCVATAMQSMVFPRPGGAGMVTASYPFLFGEEGATVHSAGNGSTTVTRAADDGADDAGGGEGGAAHGHGADLLPPDVIRSVVQAHMSEVTRCYARAHASNATLAGRVTLRFVVAPSGSVSSATTASADSGLEAVGGCIATAARAWVFPSPMHHGTVTVNYPVNLSPDMIVVSAPARHRAHH